MKRIFTVSAAAAMLASTVFAAGSDDGLKIKGDGLTINGSGGSITLDGNLEIKGDNGERVAIDGNRITVEDSSGEAVYLNLDSNGNKYTATVTGKDGKTVNTVTKTDTDNCASKKSPKSGKIVMKAVKSKMNFEKIEVSRCIRLTVEDRTEGNIIVRANEAIMPYIELSVAKGVLTARISDRIGIRQKSGNIVAEVYVPYNGRIRSIDASGASTVAVKPLLTAAELDIKASGASRIELKADAGESDIESSGASSIKADISGNKCDIDVSGASVLNLSGSVRNGAIDIAGASKCNASDMKFDSLDVEVSGASVAYVSATECTVDVSGASKADVYCDGVLSAEASAASTVRYSGNCRTNHLSSSGASSIKKK